MWIVPVILGIAIAAMVTTVAATAFVRYSSKALSWCKQSRSSSPTGLVLTRSLSRLVRRRSSCTLNSDYAIMAMRGFAMSGPVLSPMIGMLVWTRGYASCAALGHWLPTGQHALTSTAGPGYRDEVRSVECLDLIQLSQRGILQYEFCSAINPAAVLSIIDAHRMPSARPLGNTVLASHLEPRRLESRLPTTCCTLESVCRRLAAATGHRQETPNYGSAERVPGRLRLITPRKEKPADAIPPSLHGR